MYGNYQPGALKHRNLRLYGFPSAKFDGFKI